MMYSMMAELTGSTLRMNGMATDKVIITEKIVTDGMSTQQAEQALAILSRWAIRKAQKQLKTGSKSIKNIVTIDFSKD